MKVGVKQDWTISSRALPPLIHTFALLSVVSTPPNPLFSSFFFIAISKQRVSWSFANQNRGRKEGGKKDPLIGIPLQSPQRTNFLIKKRIKLGALYSKKKKKKLMKEDNETQIIEWTDWPCLLQNYRLLPLNLGKFATLLRIMREKEWMRHNENDNTDLNN